MKDEMNEAQQNGMTEATGERIFSVFDIPLDTTAEEAARLINEPYERGYYIHSVAAWNGQGGIGARVFAKRITHPRTSPPSSDVAAAKVVSLTKEARAMQFLRDNREMSVMQLVGAFKAMGVPRSAAWIGKKRVEIIRTERRVI